MNLSRLTASVTLAALVLGTAVPALADRKGGNDDRSRSRVSEKYEDMTEFEWGLNEVTKMSVKGIFKGRGDSVFAPGAKITLQETAVATVRLMDREAEAMAMTDAEVEAQLKAIPDQSAIAVWARRPVAALVKLGVVSKTAAFHPTGDATRLDIAVMLVKALGFDSEAAAKANAKLEFKDAHLIPSAYTGYVAVAVERKLITGYNDKTFRPQQAVKRVELAVMMGRADRLIDKEKQDEYKGVVKAVNATAGSFVVTVGTREFAVKLAANASIFVNDREKSLADLTAGMKVEVKLNQAGEAVYVEAKSPEAAPVEGQVSGTIHALTPATALSLALVTIDGTVYPVSPRAVLTLDGQAATFANLRAFDTVRAATFFGVVVKLEARRAVTTVTGTVESLAAATASAPAQIGLKAQGSTTVTLYSLPAAATILINGTAAAFADLRAGDAATLRLGSGVVEKIEVTRSNQTVIEGTITGLNAVTTGTTNLGQVSIGYTLNGSFTLVTYNIPQNTAILLNGQAASFADLRLNDRVKATLQTSTLVKLEATR